MVEKELMKDLNYFIYIYIYIYMDFKKKYLKYKKKYLELKKQSGSGNCGEPCYNPGDIVENTDNSKILKVVKNKYVGANNSE